MSGPREHVAVLAVAPVGASAERAVRIAAGLRADMPPELLPLLTGPHLHGVEP